MLLRQKSTNIKKIQVYTNDKNQWKTYLLTKTQCDTIGLSFSLKKV